MKSHKYGQIWKANMNSSQHLLFNRTTTIAAQTCHVTMDDCNMTVTCVYMKQCIWTLDNDKQNLF